MPRYEQKTRKGRKTLICDNCGCEFTVNSTDYRKRMANPVGAFHNKACYHEFIVKKKTNLSDEKLISRLEKQRGAIDKEIKRRTEKYIDLTRQIVAAKKRIEERTKEAEAQMKQNGSN